MSLSKPFYRIVRPKAYIPNYVLDPRYATDRIQLSRAYINIERELRNIYNYIEPAESNLGVHSIELYSLLLRACTEVELNCKKIMEANGATPERANFSMVDYKKLEKSSLLSKYTVVYNSWRQRNTITGELEYVSKELRPFANFDLAINRSPDWYVAYNEVKHNREENLEKANLGNSMNAVAGILVLLYSQFGSQCIETYGSSGIFISSFDDYDLRFDADVIFSIQPPDISDWNEEDLYEFNWNELSNEHQPFSQFQF